jgi:ribosomal protein L37AE/L43A
MNCPACGSRATGRVGLEQYYCWDCCVEWTAGEGGVHIYALDEEGELMAFDPERGAEDHG